MPTHDTAARRRGKRSGRERGCWLYVPAETLERAGWSLEAPPPWYRLWGSYDGSRGAIVARLYPAP
jgi:hypothetical protein